LAIYTLGIDVGSTASKCIILKDGKDIVAKSLISVGTGTSGPQRAIEQVLQSAGMTREDMDYTLATGYGRNSLEGIADKQMSELSCHARGAYFLFPKVHTVIDIGGQDVKVLKIENGAMVNFQMNDKCAAGTGRFLDVMAKVLEVKVRDLERLSAESTKRSRSAPPARCSRRARSSASFPWVPTSAISLRASIARWRGVSSAWSTGSALCRILS
jgi:predicted CoA-substrate-specific enzyme activase